jgi:ERCC4-type nuclease
MCIKITEDSLKRPIKSKEFLKHQIISNIYGIGPKTTDKLINKFSSIKNIVNAKEFELEEILGTRQKSFLEIMSI